MRTSSPISTRDVYTDIHRSHVWLDIVLRRRAGQRPLSRRLRQSAILQECPVVVLLHHPGNHRRGHIPNFVQDLVSGVSRVGAAYVSLWETDLITALIQAVPAYDRPRSALHEQEDKVRAGHDDLGRVWDIVFPLFRK